MKLTTITHVSVDGVMQGLGGAYEDRRGGFERGGWAPPLFVDEASTFLNRVFQRADAFLLGRRTYEIFAGSWGVWPDPGDSPIWTALNTKPKYVASTTLNKPRWAKTTVLSSDVATAVAELKASPTDDRYDEARRLFYGGIDLRPAAIVRVANTDDVARVVINARETGAELAVRSGGHSPVGHSLTDGGLVLDLHDMRRIDVDPASRTAWAETGATAVEFATAAGAHGLGVSFGDTGSVGLGGLVPGGGVGYLVRKLGLTIDNLTAAEIVTADGTVRRVDAEHEPDLFWAIRGGGGNFGVATRFQLRLHDVEPFTGGLLMQPASARLIENFVAISASAPDELTTIANS